MVKELPSTSTSEVFNWMTAEFLVILTPNLHKFEELKIANFFNPAEVYFLVTRVFCMYVILQLYLQFTPFAMLCPVL